MTARDPDELISVILKRLEIERFSLFSALS
jgi:hypothetical protein